MWWSLFLLVVMCQCSFSTCHRYDYIFINESKTWAAARSYCRENYTDLATVYNMSDMKRLQDSAGSSAGAWIGLYSKGEKERKWHWSQPGKVYSNNTANWEENEPNDFGGPENCVRRRVDMKWEDVKCTLTHKFICYNESSAKKPQTINETKTWTDAQSYCREHHTDLVSGDQLEGLKNGEVTGQDIKWWIGLFRDVWLWSDGSNSSFRHWESFHSGQEQHRCAYLQGSGKWDSGDCSESRSFFCYEENMILIQQNLTWDDAVDYCREHHHDLVSITNHEQQRQVEQRAKNATTPYVWLGLRYSCVLDLWFWVNDYTDCDDNWAEKEDPDECDHCAAMEKGRDHKWFKRDETDLYNFICVI